MLTRERIVAFIGQYIDDHGYSPTIRDVAAGCRISSTSVVAYHLHQLEQDGLITRAPAIARSIRVVANVA